MKLSASFVLGALAASAAASVDTVQIQGTDLNYACSDIVFTSTSGRGPITCKTLELVGTVTQPKCELGTVGANFDKVTFSDCLFGYVPATLTSAGGWAVVVTGKPSGNEWPAQIQDVVVDVNISGICKFTIKGVINGIFNTETQIFDPEDDCKDLKIAEIVEEKASGCVIGGASVGATIGIGGVFHKVSVGADIKLNILNAVEVDVDAKVGL